MNQTALLVIEGYFIEKLGGGNKLAVVAPEQGKGLIYPDVIVDGGGGESVLISDVCAAQGVELPPLTESTAKGMEALLGPVGSVLSNPVDMSQRQAEPEVIRRTLDLLAGEPQIDVLLVYESAGVLLDHYPWEIIQSVNGVILDFFRKKVKPLVVVLPWGVSGDRRGRIERQFVESGIPVFCDIRRAAVALSKVCTHRPR